MCRSACSLVVLAVAAAGCGSSARVFAHDAAPDDGSRGDAVAPVDAAVDVLGDIVDSATPPDTSPRIVKAWLGHEFSSTICHPYQHEIMALLARNSNGDPAGAKQFLVWLEEQGGDQWRLTFGVGERVGPDLLARYRFATDPAPAVVENLPRRVFENGDVLVGGLLPASFAVSVTPDAPENPFLIAGGVGPDGNGGLMWGAEGDALPARFVAGFIPLSVEAACMVNLHESTSLGACASHDGCGLDVDVQACTCACCEGLSWTFDLMVTQFDEVDLVVGP